MNKQSENSIATPSLANATSFAFEDIHYWAFQPLTQTALFTNQKYDYQMKRALEAYRLNPSLDPVTKFVQGHGPPRSKRNLLLGMEELLQHNFITTVQEHAKPELVGNARVLDGADRFLGQVVNNKLGFDQVIDWLLELNDIPEGRITVNFKSMVAFFTKIFVRGKCMDDLVRGAFIADNFEPFWEKLARFEDELPDFFYWIEDDRDGRNWNTIKLYICNRNCLFYGKSIAMELQLVTPDLWVFKKESTSHQTYERSRMALDKCVPARYEAMGKNFGEMCDYLKDLDPKLEELVDEVLSRGIFVEKRGDFIGKSEAHKKSRSMEDEHLEDFHQFQWPMDEGAKACLMPGQLDDSDDYDNIGSRMLTMGNFVNPSNATPFQVCNGKVLVRGGQNYYLTKERFTTDGTKIEVEFFRDEGATGEFKVGFCPRYDCYYGGPGTQGDGQTCAYRLFDIGAVWVRNGIFFDQVDFDEFEPYCKEDTDFVATIIVKNEEFTYLLNGVEVGRYPMEGSGIDPENGFHFGIFCFQGDFVFTMKSIRMEKV